MLTRGESLKVHMVCVSVMYVRQDTTP